MLVWTFLLIVNRLVSALLLGHKPFQNKFNQGETKARTENSKVRCMDIIELLGYE